MEEILSKNNNISFIDNLCLTEITNSKDFNKENMDINLNHTEKEINIVNYNSAIKNNIRKGADNSNVKKNKTNIKHSSVLKEKNSELFKSNNKINNLNKTPVAVFRIEEDENDAYDINTKPQKAFNSNIKSKKKTLTSAEKKELEFIYDSNMKQLFENNNNQYPTNNVELAQETLKVEHFLENDSKNFNCKTPISCPDKKGVDPCINNTNEISNFENMENLENIDIPQFYSRYTTLEKGSNLLSHKRKREQLIKESFEAFGFSFDSSIDLKKGFSKVEKEKNLQKQKREDFMNKQTENKEETVYSTHIKNEEKNKNSQISDSQSDNIKSKNNYTFMQDAIVKKCRIERDKEKYLAEQKILKDTKISEQGFNKTESPIEVQNTNSTYLSFKQRKRELLNGINSGN